jgi:hypothetical protein
MEGHRSRRNCAEEPRVRIQLMENRASRCEMGENTGGSNDGGIGLEKGRRAVMGAHRELVIGESANPRMMVRAHGVEHRQWRHEVERWSSGEERGLGWLSQLEAFRMVREDRIW